ncbi:MAG: hypothetical protein A3I68_06185 [Candidatus Melainabacteria bacterium RIFCSPLOWO2_02_FULL_35_15]|nr:MAG: hypothetical protein A3F80_08230 [Candidatus Melainabacteria bacterium RIFCSPLOWO2_12_FULL_35_11]OGI14554.1 MAG: hypothetical protein A3I68_06185 [Candidatus Melainabacteria bacterium RIFCSPLOWO2_02_FULL_35_15]
MNVLFFNRSFYPDSEATGQFLTELCEDLTAYGHKISVISGRSYHVRRSKRVRVFYQYEEYKSIKIFRALGTIFPKRILLFRIINLGTYFLSAFFCGFLLKEKPDVIVVQTDPPVLGLLGIFFAKWYRAKLIYSCKDIYPEVGIITGRLRSPYVNFLLEKINLITFKFANMIICLGEDMKKRIINKGIKANKIRIVTDWVDSKSIYPVLEDKNPFRKKYNFDGYFTIMYSGNIGLTQGLDKIIDLAEYFKEEPKIKFILVGEGADKLNLQKKTAELKLTNVEFLPYQSSEDLKHSLSAPDVHIITFMKGLAGVMVPCKIYGILGCARPFIAWIDEESSIYSIAQKFNCGITVSSGDIKKMIKAIEWAVNHPEELKEMGKNGYKAVLENYERRIATANFNDCLMEVSKNSVLR